MEKYERPGEFYDAARTVLGIERGFWDRANQIYLHTLNGRADRVMLEKRNLQQTVNEEIIARARQLYEKGIAKSKDLLNQINDDNYSENGQKNHNDLLCAAEDAMSAGLDEIAQQMTDIAKQIIRTYKDNGYRGWTWITFP